MKQKENFSSFFIQGKYNTMVYNDLEIASQYAQQDISQQLQPPKQAQTTQTVQFATKEESICELEGQKDISVKIESNETGEVAF